MAEKVNFELHFEAEKGECYCCRGVTDFTALLRRQMSSLKCQRGKIEFSSLE